ncbi:MAG: MinD/ParA family protein [Firmicutes bacterium]|jgi:flagellar biosynthesis protein FlhG|uniref:MinD/ParA family protein n=1 Tax=Sulfobacillus benefaciens TaxID=453960 RepID=A0A2T2X6N4_9FIRM|nr:MinD/ParA family protein [Bacillota bacterium]MCL5015704.1 MinD/ParA family protein [Bacillota bacterium]PSR30127.1 MAG: MinD/ParA family protein [Sulfobacillus benefaciens]
MAEQAEQLRQWIKSQSIQAQREVLESRIKGSRVVAITSGKGGVGKSHIALNLALALQQRGQRTVILDADLGLANINILLGYEPSYTLWDVVQKHLSIRDVLQKGPLGIRIIPGASGISRLASLDAEEISGIIKGFQDLESECDWLLVDTAAGIAPGVLSFVLAADEALIVTNPEPPALADAYGLIKSIWQAQGRVSLQLIMNRSASVKSGEEMGMRVINLTRKMLNQNVGFFGAIREDSHAVQAIARQTPLVLLYPASPAAQDIGDMADRMIHRIKPAKRGRWEQFIYRIGMMWPSGPKS